MIPALLAFAACAAPQSDPALTTRVRSAALFKNGFAFVRREAALDPERRSARIERLPPPVHGSLWLSADPARVALGAAVARRADIEDPAPALSIDDLLRANVGRSVGLLVGDDQWVHGTLLAVPEPPAAEPLDPRRGYRPYAPQVGNLVLVAAPNDVSVALRRADVRRVTATGELTATSTHRRPGAALTLAYEPRGSQPIPLSVAYLARGLTWAPSYAIDVSDPRQATLTAKAEVIDESEDLVGATLQFVTGYPNLRYAHVVDPLAMLGDLDTLLAALSQAPPDGADARARRGVLSQSLEADSFAGFPVFGPPAGGESAEDLFLYEQRDVTLARGERAAYPLFSVRVPYEHLYEWSIPNTIDERPQPRGAAEPEREEEIWHSVRLTNDSSVPWTTAPALTMKGGTLLGQDMLEYAAVGARTTVRITRAVDVQGEQAEFEVERQRDAARFYGRSHDRVVVRGEARVTNRKRESVRLEITKLIEGELTKNPQQAQVAALAKGLRRVNANLRLVWSITLEPGQSSAVQYEYALFTSG